ncbi:hypothetical protein K504DRAFT_459445 [Pleomassaria siparia CBS 279.74]|uniref:Uncharacterized protein n=1 Tax=Pleomassaria siparia CBS 279.74 TaxID=1314801 RepID=A0A6G1K0T3_9PLEO|nr:hypothetical protein K504DRAFT_459445 [Pleomassaria siparia CBS 279.74]
MYEVRLYGGGAGGRRGRTEMRGIQEEKYKKEKKKYKRYKRYKRYKKRKCSCIAMGYRGGRGTYMTGWWKQSGLAAEYASGAQATQKREMEMEREREREREKGGKVLCQSRHGCGYAAIHSRGCRARAGSTQRTLKLLMSDRWMYGVTRGNPGCV